MAPKITGLYRPRLDKKIGRQSALKLVISGGAFKVVLKSLPAYQIPGRCSQVAMAQPLADVFDLGGFGGGIASPFVMYKLTFSCTGERPKYYT